VYLYEDRPSGWSTNMIQPKTQPERKAFLWKLSATPTGPQELSFEEMAALNGGAVLSAGVHYSALALVPQPL
jgi:hypothetical protein